jgi:hypothetical protein
LVNQAPFFDFVPTLLNFSLSKDESYFEAFFPDIFDANDDFESITIASEKLGSAFNNIGGKSTNSERLEYDEDENFIKIFTLDEFNSTELELSIMEIDLSDSFEKTSKYRFMISFETVLIKVKT